MPDNALVVLCNWPDAEAANQAARALVGERLAACVSVGAPVTSVYRWQDQVETAFEYPLIVKTTADGFAALEAAIRARHPYDVPEIIAVPVADGSADYLHWIGQCVTSS